MRHAFPLLLATVACRPVDPAPAGKAVVVVIDGVRWDEAFSDGLSDLTGAPSVETMPRVWSELVPQGTLVQPLYNMGTTITAPAHAALFAGARQRLANLSVDYEPYLYRADRPSLGEELRLQQGASRSETLLLANQSLIWPLEYSLMPGYGPSVGSDWFLAADEPGSTQPAQEDESVFTSLRHALDEGSPRLVLVNLKEVDRKGHYGKEGEYVGAVQQLDDPLVELWERIQASEVYADDTLLVITTDHGRHRGGTVEEELWRNHGDPSAGDREIPLLLVGPGVRAGEVVQAPHALEDVIPTVAALMGVELPWATGMPILDALDVDFDPIVRSGVAELAVDGETAVEVRFTDDPSGRTEVWWGQVQLSDPDAWAAEGLGLTEFDGGALACWRELALDLDWMPWEPRCAVLASGSATAVGFPEERVGPFWQPELWSTGGVAWVSYAHNPDDIAELGFDGDVAARVASWDGADWRTRADPLPVVRYPTDPSGVSIDDDVMLAYAAHPAGNRARELRRIYLQAFHAEVESGPLVSPAVELDLDAGWPIDSLDWRIEHPALRADGELLELLALGIADETRVILYARSEDRGITWSPAEVLADDPGLYTHLGPLWLDSRAAWSTRVAGFAQVCVDGEGCHPLPTSRLGAWDWDGERLHVVLGRADGVWETAELPLSPAAIPDPPVILMIQPGVLVAILPILTVPHPLLTQKSRPVEADEFGPELLQHMQNMAETMYAAPGVGLAGVQVGDLRRLLVADIGDSDDEEGESGRGRNLIMLVNPEIVSKSKQKITWEEGCLSVPELWEDVTRPRFVTVRFHDPLGEVHEQSFEDYPAVVVQHEMDHLDGVVILDRISRLKRSRYMNKVRKAAKRLSGARLG